jgi:transcriptional regulator with XRE-family HTH domain
LTFTYIIAKKRSANNKVPNANEADSDRLRIGRQTRDLRKAKGFTLIQLAQKLGKSVGYISQVERGVSSLPIPVLQSISEAPSVQIMWFFHQQGEQNIEDLDYVVRANNRRKLDLSGTGISEERLSPSLGRDLLMILTTFPPGAKSDGQP